MPNPTGYLTENSLRRYPFKELNSVTAQAGFQIPDDFIVDAQITLHSLTADKVFLTQLRREVTQVNSAYTWDTTFVFAIENRARLLIETIEFSVIGDPTTQPYTTVKKAFTNVDVKVTIGPGFFAIQPTFAYNFPGGVELDDTVVIPAFTQITSVDFLNYATPINTLVASVSSGDVKVKGGANVYFENVNNTAEVSVVQGRGEGLFDPCGDIVGIKHVNDIAPDNKGNINLVGANCFDIIKKPNALQLEHLCSSKCTADQIAAYAHYINRLKDALLTISRFAEATRQKLLDQMNSYSTRISTLSALEAPFIEVEELSSRNPQKLYNSFAVGIYNPGRTGASAPIQTTLSVVPEAGAGFVYMPGTASTREDDVVQNLPSYGYVNRAVPCRSMLEHSFVIYNTNLAIANKHVELFLAQVGTANNSSAYKMQVLYPTAAYFTVKYKKIWTGTQYHYKFTINLFDKSITSNATRKASLILNFPSTGSLQLVNGTLTLDLNRVRTKPPTPNLKQIGLQNMNINFTHKAEITFEATSGSGSFATGINFMVLSVPSSFFRTVLVS